MIKERYGWCRLANDDHRTGRNVHHSMGNASYHQALNVAITSTTHNNGIDTKSLSLGNDFLGGVPTVHDGFNAPMVNLRRVAGLLDESIAR